MKGIIVDDELNSCEVLRILIDENCKDIEIAGIAHNVSNAILLIKDVKPDIVFLDIQMDNETGFDLLSQFPENISFEVIFITAHSEYAIKAIKFAAVGYLLKPISIEELKETVASTVKKIRENQGSASQITTLLKNLNQHNSDDVKLALPTQNGLVFIKVSSIIYCEGSDN